MLDRVLSCIDVWSAVAVRRVDHHRGTINVPLPGFFDDMSMLAARPAIPLDGRQSETARAMARGTARLLLSLGLSCVSELPLPSGRRADLVALDGSGDIWIVEIKSSVADFRADQKWMDYRLHCDRLFFATTLDVPCEIFPPDTGLIVADAFGASIVCEAPEHRLPRRRARACCCAMPAPPRCGCRRCTIRAGRTGRVSEPSCRGVVTATRPE